MKMGLLTFAISLALGIIASVIIGYLSAMGYTKASDTIVASNALLSSLVP